MNSQEGYIFGYPIDSVLNWVNVGYLVLVAFTAAFSVAVWKLSAVSSAAKDRALVQYQADANVKIHSADEKADAAVLQAAISNKMVAELSVEAEKLKATNLRLEAQAASAQRDAEQAKLEQKQIEEAVAWRVLRPDQMEALGTNLQRGGGSVTIGWIANDPGSLFLALQISNVFDRVNEIAPGTWKIQNDARSYSHRLLFGVFVPTLSNAATNVVRQALSAANVEFSTDDVPDAAFQLNSMTTTGGPPTADAFIMIVSKKPPM